MNLDKIDWKTDKKTNITWAMYCDFDDNDFENITLPSSQCGLTCLKNVECTHFSWDNYKGRSTCWMKNGLVSEQNAFFKYQIDDGKSQICGIVSSKLFVFDYGRQFARV